jgi:hypothetical protein
VCCSQVITNNIVKEKYLLSHCGSGTPQLGITKSFSLPLSSMSVSDASAADYMVSSSDYVLAHVDCTA